MEQKWWIPAGSFEMGDHLDEIWNAPVHTMTLDEFYMGIHEVPVGQFKQFVNQMDTSTPVFYSGEFCFDRFR